MDNLYFELGVSAGFAAVLLIIKAVWGRFILRYAMNKPYEESFKAYIIQSVLRSLFLLGATLLIIFGGYADTVYFLIVFIGGFFFVQIFEIKYLLSLEKIA